MALTTVKLAEDKTLPSDRKDARMQGFYLQLMHVSDGLAIYIHIHQIGRNFCNAGFLDARIAL